VVVGGVRAHTWAVGVTDELERFERVVSAFRRTDEVRLKPDTTYDTERKSG
jgi:hypothetical protein